MNRKDFQNRFTNCKPDIVRAVYSLLIRTKHNYPKFEYTIHKTSVVFRYNITSKLSLVGVKFLFPHTNTARIKFSHIEFKGTVRVRINTSNLHFSVYSPPIGGMTIKSKFNKAEFKPLFTYLDKILEDRNITKLYPNPIYYKNRKRT